MVLYRPRGVAPGVLIWGPSPFDRGFGRADGLKRCLKIKWGSSKLIYRVWETGGWGGCGP